MSHRTTRRTFLKHAAFAGAALPLAMPPLVRAASPNGTVRLAGIGVGGKGWSDIQETSKANNTRVIALCDVDANSLARAADAYTDAKTYADWRKLLDEQGGDLDGVTVSTPDHMHAPITLSALQRGIATYTQKPMTRTVHEARQLTEAARQAGVTTQMGNQGHSSVALRTLVDLIQQGVIGKVKEAHTWSNRPIWPQGMRRPEGSDPVPDHLDWDAWLGVASERPYKQKYESGEFEGQNVYAPFVWRGWYDFGTGALGDMGCHIIDPVYWALGLTAPQSIQYDGPEPLPEAFPTEETITWTFPGTEHTEGDQVTMKWYDGGRKPENVLPEEVRENINKMPDNGYIFVGTEGVVLASHGGGPQVYPRERLETINRPEIEPHNHYTQWTNAIRGEDETTSNFDYAGPLTETVLLGVIASRVADTTLKWDAENLEFTNSDKANRYVRADYREGWKVEGL